MITTPPPEVRMPAYVDPARSPQPRHHALRDAELHDLRHAFGPELQGEAGPADSLGPDLATWEDARRRALVMAMLPKPRYQHIYEAGCGRGDLTRLLRARADHVTACDHNSDAVDGARRVLSDLDEIELSQAPVLEAFPGGPVDLVVASESLYHLSAARLDECFELVQERLRPGGHLLLSHLRLPVDDSWLDGDEVHERAYRALAMPLVVRHVDERFRIDLWEAPLVQQP